MKKIIFSILLLNSFLFSEKLDPKTLENIPTPQLAKYIAKELNKSYPKMLDHITQTVRATSKANKVVIYNLTNSDDQLFIDAWKNKEIYKKNNEIEDSRATCQDPILKRLIIKKALIFNYKYFDINKNFLFENFVSKSSCK